MIKIRSKTLTPEYIKEFGNAIDNFATDESTNSDYAFDFVSSESGINFISPEGKINNELEKIIKVIRSCETHNECMKLQNTSNDVFDNLIGGGDNMVTGKN